MKKGTLRVRNGSKRPQTLFNHVYTTTKVCHHFQTNVDKFSLTPLKREWFSNNITWKTEKKDPGLVSNEKNCWRRSQEQTKQWLVTLSPFLLKRENRGKYVLGHKKIDSLRHIRLTRNFNHPYFALSTFREWRCQVTIFEMNLNETHKKYIKISHFLYLTHSTVCRQPRTR